MKPASFVYHRPCTINDALDLLTVNGEEAKILAGGQSLIPMMNMRLASPEVLIDINKISELDYLRRDHDGLHIGAMTRQATIEKSKYIKELWSGLHDAIRVVAHAQIRERGTIGGSICHADSRAELPCILNSLDAEYSICSLDSSRQVSSSELFIGPYQTSIGSNEILTKIFIPKMSDRSASAFSEFSHRRGDFAIGAAAAVITTDANGICREARVTVIGAGPIPIRATDSEALLRGTTLDQNSIRNAADAAVDNLDPRGGDHDDKEFARDIVHAQVTKSLCIASKRLLGGLRL